MYDARSLIYKYQGATEILQTDTYAVYFGWPRLYLPT